MKYDCFHVPPPTPRGTEHLAGVSCKTCEDIHTQGEIAGSYTVSQDAIAFRDLLMQ